MNDVLKGKLSIVTTVYKSSDYIDKFFEKTDAVLLDINCTNFEIIIVNDGSPDDSLKKLISIKNSKSYPITIIDFSRNYGHNVEASHMFFGYVFNVLNLRKLYGYTLA